MKHLLILVFAFITIHGFSQPKIGLQAGLNLADLTPYGPPLTGDYGIQTHGVGTFNAGVVTQWPLAKRWTVQPSLLVFGTASNLIGSSGEPDDVTYRNTNMLLIYLRLPVNIVYTAKLFGHLNFLLGAGGYIAQGVSGTDKGHGYTSSILGTKPQTIDDKVNFTNSSSADSGTVNVKPIDVGFNILAGLEWKNFDLTANLSHGFTRAYCESNFNFKNTVCSISLAYLFSLKK